MFMSHQPDEYILTTERRVIRVRRHWTIIAWDLFEAAALLAVLMMVSYLLPTGADVVQNVLWYGGILVLLRFAYTMFDWWDERLVVTDKRLVLFTGVFTTRVAMMPIGKVTDLTYERNAAGRLLGYGTVIVESAGQIQAFNRITHLPHPEEIYDAISELVFGDKQAQSERFSMIKAQRLAYGRKKART
jgi:uncharacterized membrane protein YdbT with pleckstrin-like domain